MKIALKIAILFGISAMVLFFSGCQLDEQEIQVEELMLTDNLDAESIALVVQMATNDGSFDNIVDGASCIEINFPYRVEINDVEYEINSESDFDLIEFTFDAYEDDTNTLQLQFPITITTADHSEMVINSIEELNSQSASCIEAGLDDDIECIDIIYPLTLFTFNTSREQINSVIVSNDSELRRFLTNLGADDVVSIDFPVRFELYDNSNVTVNSLDEFKMAILDVANSCDEDDDSNFNDDDFTEESLKDALISCNWYIDVIALNSVSTAVGYENVLMNFTDDGRLTYENLRGDSFLGLWGTNSSFDGSTIDLQFDELESINGVWVVYEINPFKIKFANDRDDKIILNSACNPDFVFCDSDFITETLSNCTWIIADNDGSAIEGLLLDFSNMNIDAFGSSGESQDQGSWSVEENVLSFDNLSGLLADYIGQWTILECNINRLKLESSNNQNIILEKVCD